MKSVQYDPNWKINGMTLLEYLYQEIVVDDVYQIAQLKDHQPIQPYTFIDIGANVGVFSIFARKLFPNARIIAIEPCNETFDALLQNTNGLDIECHNFAFGDGSKLFLQRNQYHSGGNLFLKYNYMGETIESKSLYAILIELAIKQPYVIKMDIEGGEYFLLSSPYTPKFLKDADHFAMEAHFITANTQSTWEKWLDNTFTSTHSVTMSYTPDGRGAIYIATKRCSDENA